MFLRTSLVLCSSLALLGACSTEPLSSNVAATSGSGTVKLRVQLRHESLPAIPISDNFVSALVGTPVEVLTGPEVCPPRPADSFSHGPEPTCSLSLVLRHAQHGNTDVEFSVASSSDAGTTNVGELVARHLELGKPMEDAITVGPYTVQATYLEPAPRLEKQFHEPPTLQLIPSPLRLF